MSPVALTLKLATRLDTSIRGTKPGVEVLVEVPNGGLERAG